MVAKLTLGPVLFNWPAESWRDFYFRIADEAPVDVVYVGEAVCSKRAPLFDPYIGDVTERLERGGKQVIFSTLSEVMSQIDRKVVEKICAVDDHLIEANDVSVLWRLDGRACTIGPYINVYNEDALDLVVRKGATSVCLPPEMPQGAIAVMCEKAKALGVDIEVQVYGRIPLALSARCYHARAHGRTKDSCQFVCDEDADGMEIETLDDEAFLAINGIQTMSYGCLNLAADMAGLARAGVSRFRLSPQSCNMVDVAKIFAGVLAGEIEADEAAAQLGQTSFKAPFVNGFLHGEKGYMQVDG